MNRILNFTILILCLFGALSSCTKKVIYRSEKVYVLTIHKKSWSKTMLSYCAGGSDFLSVTGKDLDREYVLEATESLYKKLRAAAGNTVRLEGKMVTKRLDDRGSSDPNEISQRPVGASGQSCVVFRATRLLP